MPSCKELKIEYDCRISRVIILSENVTSDFTDMFFCGLLIFFQNHVFQKKKKKKKITNTIIVSHCLDPDKARYFVRPDLGPNCLQRLSADGAGRLECFICLI